MNAPQSGKWYCQAGGESNTNDSVMAALAAWQRERHKASPGFFVLLLVLVLVLVLDVGKAFDEQEFEDENEDENEKDSGSSCPMAPDRIRR